MPDEDEGGGGFMVDEDDDGEEKKKPTRKPPGSDWDGAELEFDSLAGGFMSADSDIRRAKKVRFLIRLPMSRRMDMGRRHPLFSYSKMVLFLFEVLLWIEMKRWS